MIEPRYKSDRVELYCADCLDVLPQLEAGSVDAVVTDPPYGVDIAKWDDDIPPQNILDECLRISSGAVIWFGGAKNILRFSRYIPQPDRVIIWRVTFSLSQITKNGMYYRWHPIFAWRPNNQRVICQDIIEIPADGHNGWFHPGTKPIKIMRILVSGFGTAAILDPFMGSGTTGVAAMQTGRSFIGIEIDPTYYAIAEKRIRAAESQLLLGI